MIRVEEESSAVNTLNDLIFPFRVLLQSRNERNRFHEGGLEKTIGSGDYVGGADGADPVLCFSFDFLSEIASKPREYLFGRAVANLDSFGGLNHHKNTSIML